MFGERACGMALGWGIVSEDPRREWPNLGLVWVNDIRPALAKVADLGHFLAGKPTKRFAA